MKSQHIIQSKMILACLGIFLLVGSGVASDFCANLRDDFYPYPGDCSKYYKCLNHVGTSLKCPGEQLFDPQYRICEDASYVNCSASIGMPPTSVGSTTGLCAQTCPSGTVIAKILDPTLCITIIRCHNANSGAYQCPHGTENVGTLSSPMCRPTDSSACTLVGGNPTPGFCKLKANGVYQNPKDCNSYFTCNQGSTTYTKCSSGQTYDAELKGCNDAAGFNCTSCGDEVRSLKHSECPYWGCCNGDFFNRSVSTCMTCGNTTTVVSNKDVTAMKCFNGTLYDNRVYYIRICESTAELTLRSLQNVLECCGATIFNPNTETCRVCGTTKKLYKKDEAKNFHCCRDTIFDNRISKCRVCETTEKLIPRTESDYFQCCGSKFYDTRLDRCKSCGTRDEIYPKDVANQIQCCKNNLYNITSHICKYCCAGGEAYAYDRSIADNWLCCGDEFYDRRVSECIQCPAESYYFDHADAVHMDCCGGYIFDTRSESCRHCRDDYQLLPTKDAHNYYCCGKTLYNTLTSECLMCSNTSHGVVKDNDLEHYSCCAGTFYYNANQVCVSCEDVTKLKPLYSSSNKKIEWQCCGANIINPLVDKCDDVVVD
ncbi:uncharacterized protein LOC130656582 [Hydractinia symbiolongicarpus]|uniref:uncharacterized protein LOC130656582 n=1 Tax=Hydractinia symbiolongicarpus TaxID=13093 RepID=UPI00254B4B06|nr:uncharacterized protein LOC130656582 [Hydractinia symbiolongicarpus]